MNEPLARNLQALHDRELARRIEAAPGSPRLAVRDSRVGLPVPIYRSPERDLSLHSLFDPLREAARLREAVTRQREGSPSPLLDPRTFYVLFEGLGGGYQIRTFLEAERLSRATVVESDLSLLKSLLQLVDLHDILADPRISFLVDPSPEELFVHLKADYLPSVMGGFLSVPLRPRIQAAPEFFERTRAAARRAIDEAAGDHTVQATFGRTWIRNIITNLSFLPTPAPTVPHISAAIVAAAGPSLEEGMESLRRLRKDRYLIAVDTALPALLAAGVTPDAVLAIDCQTIGYRHFMHGLPPTVTLFVELAAPPSIARLSASHVALSGGHPLSLLISEKVGGIPVIDTSGGNVGHSAVSLALVLGASTVHLFGADFCYPGGKPYARGTHLYDYFRERECRTEPLEGEFAALIYRNTTSRREIDGDRFRYTTQALTAYRDRFEQTFSPHSKIIRVSTGSGLPIRLGQTQGAIDRSRVLLRPFDGASQPTTERVHQFMRDYRRALAEFPDALPDRGAPPVLYGSTHFTSWQLFATLYPLITRTSRDTAKPLTLGALLADAKRTALSFLQRAGY